MLLNNKSRPETKNSPTPVDIFRIIIGSGRFGGIIGYRRRGKDMGCWSGHRSSVVIVVINIAHSVSAGGSSSSVECENAKVVRKKGWVFGSHSFFLVFSPQPEAPVVRVVLRNGQQQRWSRIEIAIVRWTWENSSFYVEQKGEMYKDVFVRILLNISVAAPAVAE